MKDISFIVNISFDFSKAQFWKKVNAYFYKVKYGNLKRLDYIIKATSYLKMALFFFSWRHGATYKKHLLNSPVCKEMDFWPTSL